MDSTITTLSPAFTLCPTGATIFTTFPGTAAETLTEPAPAAGAAAFGAAGAALEPELLLLVLLQLELLRFRSLLQ